MINFLMNSGRPVSTEVADTLYNTAKQMFRARKDKLKFRSPACRGVMETEGKRGSMGSVYGFQFSAKVEVGNDQTEVTFIIGDHFLEAPRGEWFGAKSLEEVDELVRQDAMREKPSRLN